MSESVDLTQLSAARAARVAAHVEQVAAIAVSARRSLSAIRWRADLLISAAEGLQGADEVRVRTSATGDESERAQVLAADPATDVAVIRLHGPAPAGAEPAPLEPRQGSLQLGESVALIGRDSHGPIAYWSSISVAGGPWQSRRGGHIEQRIELSMPFDERLEGAAVLDAAGRLVGMAVPGPRGRVLGIPAPTIERIVAAIDKHGSLPGAYLGLRLQPLWVDAATAARFGRRSNRMAVVAGVDAGSPAAAADLQPGDLIEAIEGRQLEGIDALRSLLARSEPGSTLTLGVRRGGVIQAHTLTLATRPHPSR